MRLQPLGHPSNRQLLATDAAAQDAAGGGDYNHGPTRNNPRSDPVHMGNPYEIIGKFVFNFEN